VPVPVRAEEDSDSVIYDLRLTIIDNDFTTFA
jgi:hypothetical protein